MFNGPITGQLVGHYATTEADIGTDKVKDQPHKQLKMSEDQQIQAEFIVPFAKRLIAIHADYRLDDDNYQRQQNKISKEAVDFKECRIHGENFGFEISFGSANFRML